MNKMNKKTVAKKIKRFSDRTHAKVDEEQGELHRSHSTRFTPGFTASAE